MTNIKSIINLHNKEAITEKKINYNLINKPDCPFPTSDKLRT